MWIENGRFNRFTFTNIVTLGIKLKKFDWVEQFIKDYQHKLSLDLRENYSKYQLASLRYAQKKYGEAIGLLATFNSQDDLMNLGAKWIRLKIYYGEKNWEALDSLLESMRMYLLRRKKMGYHKTYYMNIIRLTKKMIQFNGRKKNKTILIEQAKEIQVESTRNWFLTQIESL